MSTDEVHYCARCKAIIEQERVEALDETSGLRRVDELDPAKKVEASTEQPAAAVAVEATTVEPAPERSVAPPAQPAGREAAAVAAVEAAEKAPLSGPDLRTSERRKVEVNVGVRSDSHFFTGLSGDVSKGGLFVATYAELPIGGKVLLDFALPNGEIKVEGTVRWRRIATDSIAPGVGIQFEHVAGETLKLIEQFCRARPPLYYDQADDE